MSSPSPSTFRIRFALGLIAAAFALMTPAAGWTQGTSTSTNLNQNSNLNPISALLERPVIGPDLGLAEVQAYTEKRVPRMPLVGSAAEWEKLAERMRRDTLKHVVYRGRAAEWHQAKTRVVWMDTLEGGPGYRVHKLRYEALPGFWIPALLYEPEKLSGKVPVVLNVNGHEPIGKSVEYKQIRCINQVKRGMIVLNPEWIGMGQLNATNYQHGRMNQIDLCGSSGLAPFYLAMERGLDLLLDHRHADPKRVAVAGLSGGGWQTITISALDPRVTFCNPVAGYSSFRTRARFLQDLGDSEQTPCDLGVYADYAQLTAMLAPHPALLTFNAKDDCCFASDHALPPLLDAAGPIYRLYGQEKRLRWHVNQDPGNHNFGLDNRQALYRMMGDFFYPGQTNFNPMEIPCAEEVKTHAELLVDLPDENADFNSLARRLAKELPRQPAVPAGGSSLARWQEANRIKLREIVHSHYPEALGTKAGEERKGALSAVFWRLRVGEEWTVPVVELWLDRSNRAPALAASVLLLADQGRRSLPAEADKWLQAGRRVYLIDPFYFGESRIKSHESLFALLVAGVGERALGIQADQVAAAARWIGTRTGSAAVEVVATGRRTSVIALVAAGLEPRAISSVELHNHFTSLKELIEGNWRVEQAPELFCFGLLEWFDVKQLAALVSPRPVRLDAPLN